MSKKITNKFNPDELSDLFLKTFGEEEVKKVVDEVDYTKYQNDPEAFCVEQLNMEVTDDMRKIMESVKKHRITVAISANGTGKSHLAGALALWFYRAFSGSQVITLAAPPERNLVENIWGKIRMFSRVNPKIVENDKLLSLKVTPKEGEYTDSTLETAILGITIPTAGSEEVKATRVSGYHAPHQLFIADESDGIDDGVYKGIDGCMSGQHARLLCLFNPKQKLGYVYRLIRDGYANVVELSAFNHPNVISGEELIPGAVSQEKTIQRINEWTKPLRKGEVPDPSSCFEVPEFLVGTTTVSGAGKKYPKIPAGWRRIEDPAFSYVVLGRYPAQGANQLISQEWIDAARSRWELYVAERGTNPPRDIRPLLGMDVADEGVDWNVIAAKYGNYIAPLEKWRGMDVDLSATKAAAYYAELRAYQINVESDGLGSSVAPKMGRIGYWFCPECKITYFDDNIHQCPNCLTPENTRFDMIREHINARKIVVGEKSKKRCELGSFGCLRDQLWWSVREWLRTDQAMLPPDSELVEELLAPTYEVRNGKIKVLDSKTLRDKLGRSADNASALIECFYDGMGRPRISNLLGD